MYVKVTPYELISPVFLFFAFQAMKHSWSRFTVTTGSSYHLHVFYGKEEAIYGLRVLGAHMKIYELPISTFYTYLAHTCHFIFNRLDIFYFYFHRFSVYHDLTC